MQTTRASSLRPGSRKLMRRSRPRHSTRAFFLTFVVLSVLAAISLLSAESGQAVETLAAVSRRDVSSLAEVSDEEVGQACVQALLLGLIDILSVVSFTNPTTNAPSYGNTAQMKSRDSLPTSSYTTAPYRTQSQSHSFYSWHYSVFCSVPLALPRATSSAST